MSSAANRAHGDEDNANDKLQDSGLLGYRIYSRDEQEIPEAP